MQYAFITMDDVADIIDFGHTSETGRQGNAIIRTGKTTSGADCVLILAGDQQILITK